jgi:CheY-like chemotaxis protein
VTAFVGEHERLKCLEAGMDDYLAKPCSKDDMITMFRKWTSKSILQER